MDRPRTIPTQLVSDALDQIIGPEMGPVMGPVIGPMFMEHLRDMSQLNRQARNIQNQMRSVRTAARESTRFFVTEGVSAQRYSHNLKIRPVNFDKYFYDLNEQDKNAESENNLVCSICLEQITGLTEPNGKISKLSCGHIFHTQCVIPWLKNKLTCPYCRENCKKNSKETLSDEVISTISNLTRENLDFMGFGSNNHNRTLPSDFVLQRIHVVPPIIRSFSSQESLFENLLLDSSEDSYSDSTEHI